MNCIRYTPDGSRFLVGADDLEIWNLDLNTPFAFIRPTRQTGIHAFTVFPDGSRVRAFTMKNAVPVYPACGSLARLRTALQGKGLVPRDRVLA